MRGGSNNGMHRSKAAYIQTGGGPFHQRIGGKRDERAGIRTIGCVAPSLLTHGTPAPEFFLSPSPAQMRNDSSFSLLALRVTSQIPHPAMMIQPAAMQERATTMHMPAGIPGGCGTSRPIMARGLYAVPFWLPRHRQGTDRSFQHLFFRRACRYPMRPSGSWHGTRSRVNS